MPEWTFKLKTATDTDRDPIQGEFFSGEAIDNVGEALVREAIQNSLDNRLGGGPVTVRIYVNSRGEERTSKAVRSFTAGLFPHLTTDRNGLARPPKVNEACAWLAVEDFGTTGLTGDPRTWNPSDAERNNFYSFFRAEGRSDKSGSDGGRWGVGKYVFPLCSRANTFFGLTITEENGQPILLGRAILKSHRVDGIRYQPDGYFAAPREADAPPLPIRDSALIDLFRSTFKLSRVNERGLSVVIPWRLNDDTELSVDALRDSCVKDYFFPLLSGALVVEICSGPERVVLNAGTTPEYARADERLRTIVDLGAQVVAKGVHEQISLFRHSTSYAPKWGSEMLNEEITRALAGALIEERPVTIHVPLRVQARDAEPEWTTFLIHLRGEPGYGQSRPYYLRNDIRVTHASRRVIQDVHAIVEVRDGALSRLLGDSENPSHTEWRQETRGLREAYKYAPATLDFVKDSVRELLRIVNRADSAPDSIVLSDLFPIPQAYYVGRRIPRRRKDGDGKNVSEPTPDLDLPKRRQVVRVEQIDGGFKVIEGSNPGQLPSLLTVRIAYDVEAGDPFLRYHSLDFDLGNGLQVTSSGGVSISAAAENVLELEISSVPYKLVVTGFDEHRDVIVATSIRAS